MFTEVFYLENSVPMIIVIAFLLGMIIVGIFASKKTKDSEGQLVGNRNSGYFLIVGTLFATFWGAGTVLGSSGSAYHDGVIGVIEDPFAAGLALILVGLFFVKTLRRLKLRSIGELYKKRFSKNVSYAASAFMVPTYLIWTAVQLLAIGKIANVLFDVPVTLAFLVATVIVITYTFLGGILAVVWTDTIQMVIILIGLGMLLFFGVRFVGGFEMIQKSTPDGYWSFIPNQTNQVSWLAYIAMWVGMALGNVPSPDVAQRAFVAKDEKTAQSGMITAGVMYWTVGFVPILLALIGITMIDQGLVANTFAGRLVDDSELVVLLMAQELFGPVALGIFAGSLVAAVLSSSSTSLFATAVIISNDIYRPIKNETNDKRMVLMTRLSIIFVGVLSVVIAFISDNLYDSTVFAFTLLFGILFFPFILALKSKWVNSYGVLAGMSVGFLVNLIGAIMQRTVVPEPWEFFTLVPAALNLVAIIIVSYLTRKVNKATPLESLYDE